MRKIIYFFFFGVCALTMVMVLIFSFVLYPKKYENIVESCCNEYGLDSSLVYAIIKTESDFDESAISSAGAVGLMQVMPSTAKSLASLYGADYENDCLLDPAKNIRFGCMYLKYLFDKFGKFDVVICAYNAGENAVKNWIDDGGNLSIEKIDFYETKNYYFKVLKNYKMYSFNISQ